MVAGQLAATGAMLEALLTRMNEINADTMNRLMTMQQAAFGEILSNQKQNQSMTYARGIGRPSVSVVKNLDYPNGWRSCTPISNVPHHSQWIG